MDLNDVTKAIDAKRLSWEAADPGRVFLDGGQSRFGLRSTGLDDAALQVASGAASDPLDRSPPPRVDWRENGMVSPVKDQGNCGACVAFATCSAIESALLINGAGVVALSEAHLFFCGAGPDACSTGWDFLPAVERARAKGIGASADLPYNARGTCHEIKPAARITEYSVVHSARDRRRAIADFGPVIGGMKVYGDFPFYKSGVYEHATGDMIGLHAICIVGYNDEDNHWIVKNSWGADWGEAGFVRIAYGQAAIETYPFIGVEAALV